MKPWFIVGGGVVALLFVGLVLWAVSPDKTPPHPNSESSQPPPPRDLAGMIRIPAGEIRLGNGAAALREYLSNVAALAGDAQAIADLLANWETSDSHDKVDEFWIDQYEVSNAQYARFIAATGHRSPAYWNGPTPPEGMGEDPVTDVAYDDAEAFARWAGKQLPTEDQWVRAFRGDSWQFFPWGDEFDPTRANVRENERFHSISRVGETPEDVSPFGVCNLAGNAAEIIRGRPFLQDQEMVRIKGGDWRSLGAVFSIGSSGRYVISNADGKSESEQFHDQQIGFRCVYEAPDR